MENNEMNVQNNETIEPVVKQKSNKGLIVLIIILILMVLGLSGYLIYDKFVGKEETPVINNTQTDNGSKKVLKKDESKDIVYTLYTGKGIDDFDTIVPYINIDSSSVQELNKKIEDLINNSGYKINYEKNAVECKDVDVIDNNFIECPYLKYKSYINNNILSIVIYKDNAMDPSSHQYYAYNIDIYTGKEITNRDLVKLKNISESDFEAKLSNTFKEAYPFDKYYTYNNNYPEEKDFATQRYNKTTELQNCSIDNPMFLNENGELNVILGVYYYAGGDGTIDSLVNMDTKQFIYYEDYKM